MADTLKNGVVYGVVLYGKGVLDAQNALYSEQKPTVRTTKHVHKAERRIAKSLESQGCGGSNPLHSAISQEFRASDDFDVRLFFCKWIAYGASIYYEILANTSR